MTFSGIDHNLHSTVKLKMSKNSAKTILITLYSSAVQDPEPLSNYHTEVCPKGMVHRFLRKIGHQIRGLLDAWSK